MRDTFEYQDLAIGLIPKEALPANNESEWHQPWSEPVRFRRLATAHQQVKAEVPLATFVIPLFESAWHQTWSEPVRQKKGLSVRLQSTLSQYPGPIIVPDVMAVMAAVETNSDTAESFVWVHTQPIDLTSVNISIKEVLGIEPPQASIVETTGGASPVVTTFNSYVAEDGVTLYVAEDGTTLYIQEL